MTDAPLPVEVQRVIEEETKQIWASEQLRWDPRTPSWRPPDYQAALTRVAHVALAARTEQVSERERAAIELLKRLYDWDTMGLPNSDGAYWRKEIMSVVAPCVPVTTEDIAWAKRVLESQGDASPPVPEEK
jgi:hypothetical protein